MKIINNPLELIGNTPILYMEKLERDLDLKAHIFLKIEKGNLTGSVKDRVAREIIETGLDNGTINKDTIVLEATSGNTGIAASAICAYYNLKCIICMPETMSIERVKLIESYGSKVIRTKGSLGMKGSVDKVNELKNENPNSIILSQFENTLCVKAHYKTTGPEIYDALDGKIDAFICGIGTGGTFTGCSKYLKEQNEDIKCFGIEPKSSPLLSENHAGPHKIQGIGANFVPAILDKSLMEEVVTITDEEAYAYTRMLRDYGLLCGISSGAALCGAIKLASRDEFKGKNIVALLPDNGERYISTGVFDE